MKTCTKCGVEKAESEFGRHKGAKDGLNGWCKECHCESTKEYKKCNLEKVRKASKEHMREWRRKNRFAQALRNVRSHSKHHGYEPCDATIEEIEAAFNGRCHICGVSELDCFKRLTLDHDHNRDDSNFRGWLCSKCNVALGGFGDSEELLINALHYLMGSKVKQ